MKKVLVIALICSIFLGLTACDPGSYTYGHIKPDAEIVSVELINYNYPNAKMINTFIPIIIPRIRPFRSNRMTVIETLEDEKLDDFSEELNEITVWTTWHHLNAPDGVNIKINYGDGSFDIFSLYDVFAGRYNKKGRAVEHWGGLSNQHVLITLVNKYFLTQI